MNAPVSLPGLRDPFAGKSGAEIKALLADPNWRIRNLYYILDKDGRTVLFVPNPVQEKFLAELWYRNVIPKARQRGFSTVVQIVMLDACIFVPNTSAAVVAQDDVTSGKIFEKKVKFAWERLPEIIHKMFPLKYDTKTQLVWQHGSSMTVSTSTRGDTLQYLHVSEYGKICAKYPDKAAEIMSGSLPSAENGIIIIESTMEGREGDFYQKVVKAQSHRDAGKKLGRMDYRLHFASWWDAGEYETDPGLVVISPKDHEYFDLIEVKVGRELSDRKRAWYVATRDNTFSGDEEMMWSQYPSTLEESYQISTEGVYLAKQLVLARQQGRITKVPYDPAYPVNTWWDLGVDDDLAIWFHQKVGAQDRFIDFYECSGEPYSTYARELKAKPYVYANHYLPHDGAHRRPGAEAIKTIEDMLHDLGIKDTVIVPRAPDLIAAINQLRMAFSTYWFDEEKCKPGLRHLEHYTKRWNERQMVWSEQPAHNGHQHAPDAIRQRAQWTGELISSGGSTPKRRNRSGMAA